MSKKNNDTAEREEMHDAIRNCARTFDVNLLPPEMRGAAAKMLQGFADEYGVDRPDSETQEK